MSEKKVIKASGGAVIDFALLFDPSPEPEQKPKPKDK